jgi:hypothetical protein
MGYSQNNLSATIDQCLRALEKYSLPRLLMKYDPKKWSLGQMFLHIVESTDFFLDNVGTCLGVMKDAGEPTTERAQRVFAANELPDIEIVGPASNDRTPQPESIESLREGLTKLKLRAEQVKYNLEGDPPSGKVKHPGLGFFNAGEWYQFADIHIRHHLRQLPRMEVRVNSLTAETLRRGSDEM